MISDAAAQVQQNVKIVKDTIEKFNGNKEMRNRARQLRTESPAAFPFIRDGIFPPDDLYKPYKIVSELTEQQRRNLGHAIFERATNYLRILAARGLYPHGKLTDQVIVRINDTGAIVGIQLVPKYLSKFSQPVKQLAELKDFLYVNVALPENDKANDFFFPSATSAITEITKVEEVAQIVETINQIDLVNNSGKVFICDCMPLSTQAIYDNKSSNFKDQNKNDLWIILSRFCNEHLAIGNLHLLPEWLNEFVKYKNPTPLPKFFLNLVNCPSPIERLRIIMGMYPTELEVTRTDLKMDQKLLALTEDMPAWYRTKLL